MGRKLAHYPNVCTMVAYLTPESKQQLEDGPPRLPIVTRWLRRTRGQSAFIDLNRAGGHFARGKLRTPPLPSCTSKSNTQCGVDNHPSKRVPQAGNVSTARE